MVFGLLLDPGGPFLVRKESAPRNLVEPLEGISRGQNKQPRFLVVGCDPNLGQTHLGIPNKSEESPIHKISVFHMLPNHLEFLHGTSIKICS